MKIYNYVRIDMDTGKTLEEDSFEYDGPMALCIDPGAESEAGGGFGSMEGDEDGGFGGGEGSVDDIFAELSTMTGIPQDDLINRDLFPVAQKSFWGKARTVGEFAFNPIGSFAKYGYGQYQASKQAAQNAFSRGEFPTLEAAQDYVNSVARRPDIEQNVTTSGVGQGEGYAGANARNWTNEQWAQGMANDPERTQRLWNKYRGGPMPESITDPAGGGQPGGPGDTRPTQDPNAPPGGWYIPQGGQAPGGSQPFQPPGQGGPSNPVGRVDPNVPPGGWGAPQGGQIPGEIGGGPSNPVGRVDPNVPPGGWGAPQGGQAPVSGMSRIAPGDTRGTPTAGNRLWEMYGRGDEALQNALTTGRGDITGARDLSIEDVNRMYNTGYKDIWDTYRDAEGMYQPYREAGERGLGRLEEKTMAGPGEWKTSDAYGVMQERSLDALEQAASQKGNLGSGALKKAILGETQKNLALDEQRFLDNYYRSLEPEQYLTGVGMGATGATTQLGAQAAGTSAQLGAQTGQTLADVRQRAGSQMSDLGYNVANTRAGYGLSAADIGIREGLSRDELERDYAQLGLQERLPWREQQFRKDVEMPWSERMAERGYEIYGKESDRNRQQGWWNNLFNLGSSAIENWPSSSSYGG